MAATWFASATRQPPGVYQVQEAALNDLGYSYLKRQDADRAICAFKIETQAFPKSPNAFDSLADAFERSGDLRAAYESVTSAAALDPSSLRYQARAKQLKTCLN